MTEPTRRRWRTAATGWLMVLTLLVTDACSSAGSGGTTEDGVHLVSYSKSAPWLAGLDPAEADEQIRDWARLALASSLGMDQDRIVDAMHDTTPLRDPLFDGLVEQPVGPGRSLFDGRTLHLLAPADDPHSARTLGRLLDQHRVDAGSDPVDVQVHEYRIRPENQKVELRAQTKIPTGEFRAANGYREAPVDQRAGLEDFLADTNHLSRLEVRGGQVWAAGWDWPDLPDGAVSLEDVSVLQRAYRPENGAGPGFSLDPKGISGVDEIHAAIPELAPGLVGQVAGGNLDPELARLAEEHLFGGGPSADELRARGLPADRTQLWALYKVLRGVPAVNEARYDGGIAGTEVGMTAFYSDLVMKDWVAGVGTGVPSGAVPGFVPNPEVPTPPGLCPPVGERSPPRESARLWLGQADGAFGYRTEAVDVGAQATRLFVRSNGPDGREVEPTYRMGRASAWWDRHYADVADYEPEFWRLEELMRWSGALDWLSESGHGLPVLPDEEIRFDLRFADWHEQNGDLRERARPASVSLPGRPESVLTVPSAAFTDCGLSNVYGGVSLGGALKRRGMPADNPLPPGLRRAEPIDPAATNVDPATGTARIRQLGDEGSPEGLTRIVRRGADGASVATEGPPRREIPFGEARLRGEDGPRSFEVGYRSNEHGTSTGVEVQGQPFGTAAVLHPETGRVRQTDVVVSPGLLGRFRELVERDRQDPEHGLRNAPDFLYSYPEPGGTGFRFGEGWVTKTTEPPPSGFVVELPGHSYLGVDRPAQLSGVDLPRLEAVPDSFIMTYGELQRQVPDTATVYVATDRPTHQIRAIEPDDLVSVQIAQPIAVPFAQADAAVRAGLVPVPEDERAWSLLGMGSVSAPPDPDQDIVFGLPLGAGGAWGSGPFGRSPVFIRPAFQVVFVTQCRPDDGIPPKIPEECAS
ncbi:hypothetical protein ACH347_10775 [Saccharopolyspora sp. 5N102]|uniref:hypothetical protein n=1 Tax=Saccharopolyspora sp. 5N102 TaxID=3375155 RepID=UPI0037AFB4BB